MCICTYHTFIDSDPHVLVCDLAAVISLAMTPLLTVSAYGIGAVLQTSSLEPSISTSMSTKTWATHRGNYLAAATAGVGNRGCRAPTLHHQD